MQMKETRGRPTTLTSGSIVVMRYKGKKWQSKAVVKLI